MQPRFQSYQLAYQGSNANAEGKDEEKMQTPVDNSSIFYQGIEKHSSFPLVLVEAPRKESLTRAKLPVR